MSDFWNSCLLQLQQELPEQQFNTWIRPLSLEGKDTDPEGFRLLVPNGFHRTWVKDRYLMRVQELASVYFAHPVSVSVVIGVGKSDPGASASVKAADAIRFSHGVQLTSVAQIKPGVQGPDKSRLISDFTFDNLVVGKANDLARAAAIKVSEQPGGGYNPLFVYGGAGLGKTHLIHAIGNSIRSSFPEKTIRYVHAEDYYSDVVRAYQQKYFRAR